MKTSLRLFTAVALLAIAAPVYAQGGGGGGMQQMTPEQRVARQKEMLFKDIALSAEQSAKADTIIMKAMRSQMEAMQAARASGDQGAAREAMQKVNSERNEALRALLTTDEHKKKFDENLAAMPQGRRGGL
jgi:Spy/CpxP family protein refolding chaperone